MGQTPSMAGAQQVAWLAWASAWLDMPLFPDRHEDDAAVCPSIPPSLLSLPSLLPNTFARMARARCVQRLLSSCHHRYLSLLSWFWNRRRGLGRQIIIKTPTSLSTSALLSLGAWHFLLPSPFLSSLTSSLSLFPLLLLSSLFPGNGMATFGGMACENKTHRHGGIKQHACAFENGRQEEEKKDELGGRAWWRQKKRHGRKIGMAKNRRWRGKDRAKQAGGRRRTGRDASTTRHLRLIYLPLLALPACLPHISYLPLSLLPHPTFTTTASLPATITTICSLTSYLSHCHYLACLSCLSSSLTSVPP